MNFSPNKIDFERGMESVVQRLEETLLCIRPLVHANSTMNANIHRYLPCNLFLSLTSFIGSPNSVT